MKFKKNNIKSEYNCVCGYLGEYIFLLFERNQAFLVFLAVNVVFVSTFKRRINDNKSDFLTNFNNKNNFIFF